jgi:hypothetical protein
MALMTGAGVNMAASKPQARRVVRVKPKIAFMGFSPEWNS